MITYFKDPKRKGPINRWTIERICGILIIEGMLKRVSKRGGYKLSEEGKKDPIVYRRLLRKLPTDKIWEISTSHKGAPILDITKDYHSTENLSKLTDKEKKDRWNQVLTKNMINIFDNKFLNFNLNQQPLQSIENISQYQDEKEIALFANKIGAIIVKILLTALHPYDLSLIDPIFATWLKTQVKGRDKDDNAKKFVQKLINPVKILNEFCKLSCVKEGLAIWGTPMKYNEEDRDNEIKKIQKSDLSESDMKNRIEFCHRHFKLAQDKNKKLRMFRPEDPTWSVYEMDNDNFERITKIYSSVFPSINKEILNLKNM